NYVKLFSKIILSSSKPNRLVIDPFGVSGTTFAVAEKYKRKWLGTKLQPEY
ncbi:MAG: site-specific DNA-methyltransferase, partial [Bacteroidales bacterium]|nr:site-specific DNA-methyltransferase [Bacteroidales bacterium]